MKLWKSTFLCLRGGVTETGDFVIIIIILIIICCDDSLSLPVTLVCCSLSDLLCTSWAFLPPFLPPLGCAQLF